MGAPADDRLHPSLPLPQATLASVNASALAFVYSTTNGTAWTQAGTVAVPALTACATALAAPVITPLGGAALGAVTVSIATTATGATTWYALTGASPAPLAVYAGPFVICEPGNTTVQAFRCGGLQWQQAGGFRP